MAHSEARTLEPIGNEPYTDRTYNQFHATPVGAIESVPVEGYVGALSKKAPAKMLLERLAEIIGVPVSSLSMAHEGKDLDMNLTLSENGINEPGPAARRSGHKIPLNFVLRGDTVPAAVLEAKAKAEAEEQARRKKVLEQEEDTKRRRKEEEERKALAQRSAADREADRIMQEKDDALRSLRRPPRRDGMIQFRCRNASDLGVCAEVHSSCRFGQLARRLLDYLSEHKMIEEVSEGVELKFCKDKYDEEATMLAKQELGEVGVKNGSVLNFQSTDADGSIGFLPCADPITLIGFRSSEEGDEIERSRFVKELMTELGRASGWPIPPPLEESEELRPLKICQLEGVTYIRNLCKDQHMESLPAQEERAAKLGFSDLDFVKTLEWVREQAPIIIHVDLKVDGHALSNDTHYKNQFESLKSRGSYGHSHRADVENKLFGKAYDSATGADRVKYGTLNFANDPKGVESARHYGKDYFQLKRVRLRTTLTSQDSFSLSSLGTPDYYAHILAAYTDKEFKAALSMGKNKCATKEFEHVNAGQYKEAQFHGEMRLADHIANIVVHESRRSEGAEFHKMLKKLQVACGNCGVLWMDSDSDMKRAAAVPKSLRELAYESSSAASS